MRTGGSPLARTRLSYSRKSYDPFISTSSIFDPSSISSLSPLNEKNDHSSSYPGPNTGEPSGVISMNPSLRAVPSGNATHSCTPSSMSARPSIIDRSTGSSSNPSWLSHMSSVIPDHPSTVMSFPASSDVLYTGGFHSNPYSLSCPSAIISPLSAASRLPCSTGRQCKTFRHAIPVFVSIWNCTTHTLFFRFR